MGPEIDIIMASALSELEKLQLVAKICSELENHLGFSDKTLGTCFLLRIYHQRVFCARNRGGKSEHLRPASRACMGLCDRHCLIGCRAVGCNLCWPIREELDTCPLRAHESEAAYVLSRTRPFATAEFIIAMAEKNPTAGAFHKAMLENGAEFTESLSSSLHRLVWKLKPKVRCCVLLPSSEGLSTPTSGLVAVSLCLHGGFGTLASALSTSFSIPRRLE